MLLPQKRHISNRHAQHSPYIALEERTSLTTRELEDMYEVAWRRGYEAAMEDTNRAHNEHIEGLNKVPNIF
jgi:hypothetical protein